MYKERGSGPSPEVKMWPLHIVCGIGQDHWKVKSGSYISCPKDDLMAVDGKVDSSGISLTAERHGLVESITTLGQKNRRGVINGSRE